MLHVFFAFFVIRPPHAEQIIRDEMDHVIDESGIYRVVVPDRTGRGPNSVWLGLESSRSFMSSGGMGWDITTSSANTGSGSAFFDMLSPIVFGALFLIHWGEDRRRMIFPGRFLISVSGAFFIEKKRRASLKTALQTVMCCSTIKSL